MQGEEEAQPGGSASTIDCPNRPKTYIYPRRQQTPSVQQNVTPETDVQPSSSGTVIFHPDAPVKLIYAHMERFKSPQSNQPACQHDAFSPRPEKGKRKREKSPPADAAEQNPSSKNSALVVLLNQNIPMATDFAAFKHEFEA